MANLENIKIVRDAIQTAIEKKEGIRNDVLDRMIGFNMVHWLNGVRSYDTPVPDKVDSCGTTACLAGWAVLVLEPKSINEDSIPDRGRDLFNLNPGEARLMFSPFDQDWTDAYYASTLPPGVSRFAIRNAWEEITAEQVVKMLDIYLETEKVDWAAALGYNLIDRAIELEQAKYKPQVSTLQDYPNA